MTHPTNRRTVIGGALAALGLTALPAGLQAAARPYQVNPKAASIKFLFTLNGNTQTGTAPLSRASLQIDPGNLVSSTADVTADISRARTGLIFATDALKSQSVLNTAQFPTARFRSSRVILGPGGRISDGAAIEGELTLRGVTHKIRFDAALYRPRGTAADDLDELQVRLRGAISRKAFGATGYPELVADRVGLDITADIRAT